MLRIQVLINTVNFVGRRLVRIKVMNKKDM